MIRPWSVVVGSTRQSLIRPWSEADPGQPDQSGPTVQACISARNQKATPRGVALIGGILDPRPGLEPGTSGLTVRGFQIGHSAGFRTAGVSGCGSNWTRLAPGLHGNHELA